MKNISGFNKKNKIDTEAKLLVKHVFNERTYAWIAYNNWKNRQGHYENNSRTKAYI